eukprot:TRINITY_DN4161_c0_g1_i1.p1 TRINITY_DN4161_c0_g1~~TRINITY_DN4161_c0_g1_i1.p1  ORF type:complete len:218 (-),score=27.10 TRINITY_DN4161_c0_g1_i1:727-1380(-)
MPSKPMMNAQSAVGGECHDIRTAYIAGRVSKQFVFFLTMCHVCTYALVGSILHMIDSSISAVVILVACYVCEVLALVTHWAGHKTWSGWWYNAHTMGHHVRDYPRKRFLSEQYQPAKVDNTKAYYATMLLAPLVTCVVLSDYRWRILAIATVMTGFVLKVADYLHMGIHTNGFWMERYNWFVHLRSMHYYHHRGKMLQNYAIADFFLDWALLGINFS